MQRSTIQQTSANAAHMAFFCEQMEHYSIMLIINEWPEIKTII